MKWNDLSMADKTSYMKLGLNNGITDLKVIRDTYNKYADGGYVRKNNHPVSFDNEGNLIDQITGEKGSMLLPEVKIKPNQAIYVPILSAPLLLDTNSE